MTFDEVLDQVRELLQRRGRVTYGALKRRFDLEDTYLEDLKGELIRAEGVAADEGGEVLVWTGGTAKEETENQRTGESEKAQTTSSDTKHSTLDSRREAGERRQLTVMFCDLVGSTALSSQLDPEELRELMRVYQETCTEVIQRYEGYIAQYLGDGLLVYFGYPRAHEDDAQRAVRAGLGILPALHALPRQDHVPLQVRIGIHTGLVVVGETGGGEKRERLALGETPNIAARIQGLAEPDAVIVSAATYRLIEGLFESEDLGTHTLKGIVGPVQMYCVRRESAFQSRFEATLQHGITPLVGRTHETELLLERWERATEGEGQVVLLSGEPGIGKSRLVQEVKERVVQQGVLCLEFRCSPYYQNSALYPVLTHLQRVLQWQRDKTPQAKLEKLQHTLARYHFPQVDTLPLLAALLSLPLPLDVPPLNLSPQKQKQKTQEALVAWLMEDTERQPVYCVWEDLHWADPSTVELLGLLLDQAPTARLLVLLTARPEFTPPWSSRTHLTPLTLTRLPRTQAAEMINKVTGGKSLPAEVQQQIVSKTDGVPLFVEELTKMVLESGFLREVNGYYELTEPLPPLAIPTTLYDSLMARLDRLATVKEVAQLAATLGREFSYELLQAVSPVEETTLHQALAKLVEAEVLYQRGAPPQSRYIFKHALIQDAAYQSLLKSRRQQYHQQIAQVLEERFPETKETQPELLAHHYTEAGFIEHALPYWQRAGQQASERSAHAEAIAHLTKGVELLKTLSDTPERAQQELTLQIALGSPLMATKGYAAPELEAAYARAHTLCQQVGETSQLFAPLRGLCLYYLIRGKLQTARKLGEQILGLAHRLQDPELLVEAHYALGDTLQCLGEFASAHEILEQGIRFYDPYKHGSLAFRYGQDPGVVCRAHSAFVLWCLGYPDQALQRAYKALTFARELSHPFSLTFALNFVAVLHQLRQEEQLTQEWAETAIILSTEQGFPFWEAWGTGLRGWVLARQGQEKEGVTQIRDSLITLQAIGAEVVRAWFLVLLAEAYGKAGQASEGLRELATARAMMQEDGEHFYEAELYRLKGELTLQQEARGWRRETGSPSSHTSRLQPPVSQAGAQEAERCFWQALEIARQQQAKSLELRAVMSLARLWQQQGKKEEARRLLSEIYHWFTEGFDTADLQEAKALLQELEGE